MIRDNSIYVLTKFISYLKIPVTAKAITEELDRHPDYDSFAAFSDTLDRFKIPNAAYHASFEQLNDISTPYIVQLTKKGFGIVTHFDDTYFTIANDSWKSKKFSLSEFKKIYAGAILLAEKDEQSGEIDYLKKARLESLQNLRIPAIISSAIILLVAYIVFQTRFVQTIDWPLALLALIKTTGVVTAVLLLIQSIDANNPLIQKLCGDDSKNCNAILSSNAAKIVDGLSWSEIGFFYFAGTWLVLIFSSGQFAIMQALALFNVLSLPYTIYSINYQWRIAKQWCIFCCTIQALLWLEFLPLLPYITKSWSSPTMAEWVSLIVGMVSPILIWLLIKPYFLKSKELVLVKRDLQKFKYNADLFNDMLNSELQYKLPSDVDSLIIGNAAAEKIITLVASPFCQPCAKAHKALGWINYRDDVKLQIIFATGRDMDQKAIVAAHLLSLRNAIDGTTLKKAMSDWYEQKQKNYEEWAKKYPTTEISSMAQSLQRQREWCKMTDIVGTPALFINGRRLPKAYRPEDLKYFV